MHEMVTPMTPLFRTGCSLVLGALLWCAVALPTVAQDDRTLTIRDGTVYVDGQQLAADQMPDDLDLTGVEAEYRFLGIQRPVIELNGRLFAVENGLRPVSREEVHDQQSSVILQEGTSGSASAQPTATAASSESSPHRQYLNDVQQANRELYERLVRERTLEKRAQTLAQSIRTASGETGARRKKADSLRTLLNDIFDLKQENRRLEVKRLQREIQELQRRLQQRRNMREQMIDRRFQQLVGATLTP